MHAAPNAVPAGMRRQRPHACATRRDPRSHVCGSHVYDRHMYDRAMHGANNLYMYANTW